MSTLYTRQNSPFFYASYTLGGIRKRFRTDHKTRREAQTQADEVERLDRLASENQGGLRLIEAAERFFKEKELKASTVEGYEHAYHCILRTQGNFILADLSPADISSYIKVRQKMPGKTAIRADLAFLSSLYTSAFHWCDRITTNPVKAYSRKGLPMAKARTTWLSEGQVAALIEACNTEIHQCLVVLAVDTGMRKQEMLKLHRHEIDFHRGLITLGNVDENRTKTRQGREIPLTKRVMFYLQRQLEAQKLAHRNAPWQGYVFENPLTGKPVTTIKTFWKAVCLRVGLKGVRFHDLRHTFATRGLQIGADQVTLMAIMGHRHPSSFHRYCHSSEESRQRVAGLLNATHDRHRTLRNSEEEIMTKK